METEPVNRKGSREGHLRPQRLGVGVELAGPAPATPHARPCLASPPPHKATPRHPPRKAMP